MQEYKKVFFFGLQIYIYIYGIWQEVKSDVEKCIINPVSVIRNDNSLWGIGPLL